MCAIYFKFYWRMHLGITHVQQILFYCDIFLNFSALFVHCHKWMPAIWFSYKISHFTHIYTMLPCIWIMQALWQTNAAYTVTRQCMCVHPSVCLCYFLQTTLLWLHFSNIIHTHLCGIHMHINYYGTVILIVARELSGATKCQWNKRLNVCMEPHTALVQAYILHILDFFLHTWSGASWIPHIEGFLKP